MLARTLPRHSSSAAAITVTATAARVRSAGNATIAMRPIGTPTAAPAQIQPSDVQCASFQIDGSRCRLTASSSRKVIGTTATGGSTIDRLGTHSSDEPKPV